MLIPIRCFTCGKVLANMYDYYVRQVETLKLKKKGEQGEDKDKDKDKTATPYFDAVKTNEIMDKMGLTRYCCRRHMLGTVDMMETI